MSVIKGSVKEAWEARSSLASMSEIKAQGYGAAYKDQ